MGVGGCHGALVLSRVVCVGDGFMAGFESGSKFEFISIFPYADLFFPLILTHP